MLQQIARVTEKDLLLVSVGTVPQRPLANQHRVNYKVRGGATNSEM